MRITLFSHFYHKASLWAFTIKARLCGQVEKTTVERHYQPDFFKINLGRIMLQY